MGAVFSFVYAFLKAVPILKKFYEDFTAWILNTQIESHDKAFAAAVVALINNKDQSLLEAAIGSTNAGKPSKDPTDIDEVSAGDFGV